MIPPVPSRRDAIADDLRERIVTGRLKPGERLPSEAHLAAQYMVSTPTLRNALAVLQAEGLIEKTHGKGNFVRRPLHRITYVGGRRTPDAHSTDLASLNVTVHTTKVRARGYLATLLKMPTGSPLIEILCLGHEDEKPHSLARIYVPCDLAPAAVLREPLPYEAVVTRLRELRPPPAEVREEISVRLPTPEEASTLRISSALAVLVVTRQTADTAGRVVEAALLVLPGDRADAVFTTHYVIDERPTRT
ncbi:MULTISPECIES: GntR family transcriptional regulator [Streptomyces]|uniref:GntR family transcriptional regulator n=1 Tax=Streptomyces violaceoruber TaxID=1935 RepID=A0ACD4WPY2_STRVN|nr:GntR family transcriptional regulator [Streptomyces sp. ME02-6978.2a]MDX3364350.1 GntR family transcriptional regulator [Streptomyces sp. ME02-6978.2a]WOY99618.1 GntR family transcriptional regulator [Streptomyces violaceoruber]BDD73184.1 GntR family transcriptional regulator [Streptomyces coelicolor]